MPDRDLDQEQCPVPDTVIEEAVEAGKGPWFAAAIDMNHPEADLRYVLAAAAPVLFEAGVQAEREAARDRVEAVHHHENYVTEAPGPLSRAQVWAMAVDACTGAVDGDEQWESPLSTGEDCPECDADGLETVAYRGTEKAVRVPCRQHHGTKSMRPENGGNDE